MVLVRPLFSALHLDSLMYETECAHPCLVLTLVPRRCKRCVAFHIRCAPKANRRS